MSDICSSCGEELPEWSVVYKDGLMEFCDELCASRMDPWIAYE